MTTTPPARLLDLFHRQIRLTGADAEAVPGWIRDVDGPVRRAYPADPGRPGRGLVECPDGLGPDPDADIARTRDFFAAKGQAIEWKTYAYDRPADLGTRLGAAGFAAEEVETLILGDIDDVLAGPLERPPGVRLRDLEQQSDFELIADLMAEIWGADTRWIGDELALEWQAHPDRLAVSLVDEVAGGPALCAAWVRFHPGTQFASLWGGGTRPEWRRKGLYRAILHYRAQLAAERGYRYLRVDASPDSRPILERLGLQAVTTTTPYVFTPSPPD